MFTDEDRQSSNLSADNQALRQTAQTILEELQELPPEPSLPQWYQRCLRPKTRTALFAAGAALVLITFLFFGSPGKKTEQKESSQQD